MWRQIAHNIDGETALHRTAIEALLADFARRLAAGEEPRESWIAACRERSQLAGKALSGNVPEVVGRALAFKQYSTVLAEDAGLDRRRAEALLQRAIREGVHMSPRLRRTLERTRVGRFVVWATFDRAKSDRHPYETSPRTTEHIRIAFGLGHCSLTEPLVLIAYGTRAPVLELRRPTIADAGGYHWYRPHADPDHPHGWTEPLPPNSTGLERQPEVVHRETVAHVLVPPIFCTK